MTIKKSSSSHAACLPRRSGTKAGVLDCGGPTRARDAAFPMGEHGTRPYTRAVSALFTFTFLIFNCLASRPVKVSQAESRWVKHFLKKLFQATSRSLPTVALSFVSSTTASATVEGLAKAGEGKSSYCKPMQTIANLLLTILFYDTTALGPFNLQLATRFRKPLEGYGSPRGGGVLVLLLSRKAGLHFKCLIINYVADIAPFPSIRRRLKDEI
jgi:hypothetical protein